MPPKITWNMGQVLHLLRSLIACSRLRLWNKHLAFFFTLISSVLVVHLVISWSFSTRKCGEICCCGSRVDHLLLLVVHVQSRRPLPARGWHVVRSCSVSWICRCWGRRRWIPSGCSCRPRGRCGVMMWRWACSCHSCCSSYVHSRGHCHHSIHSNPLIAKSRSCHLISFFPEKNKSCRTCNFFFHYFF